LCRAAQFGHTWSHWAKAKDHGARKGAVFLWPRMAGMPEMQEQFPAGPRMAGMPEMQEQFPADAWVVRLLKTKEQFPAERRINRHGWNNNPFTLSVGPPGRSRRAVAIPRVVQATHCANGSNAVLLARERIAAGYFQVSN
jgi:hypothetical protein